MKLRPLRTRFTLEFLDTVRGGYFVDRPSKKSSGLIIISAKEGQTLEPRWVRVTAVGDEVKEFGPGAIVLLEKGQWTPGFFFNKKTYWTADAKHVMAIAPDEASTLK